MSEMIEFKLKMKLPKKCCDCPFAHIEDRESWNTGEWDVDEWCQFPDEYGDPNKMPFSDGRNDMSIWCPIREILNEENKA